MFRLPHLSCEIFLGAWPPQHFCSRSSRYTPVLPLLLRLVAIIYTARCPFLQVVASFFTATTNLGADRERGNHCIAGA